MLVLGILQIRANLLQTRTDSCMGTLQPLSTAAPQLNCSHLPCILTLMMVAKYSPLIAFSVFR